MSRTGIEAGRAVIRIYVDDKVNQGLKQVQSRLQKFSYSLSAIGSQALRGGLIGSIASGALSNEFMKFEDVILNLRAKLGLFDLASRAQNKTIKDLENTVRLLGKSTSYTAREVGDAATSLAQAGFSAREIKDTLQAVLDLARGTGYELGESADMLANALRTFNIETNRAGEIVSQFVRATRLGTLEIVDLREALKYASGSAFNLGQTLPVVLGLLVQASESGLKASLAGTSLNTALLNLVKNLEKLQGKFPGFVLQMDRFGKLNLMGTLRQLYSLTAAMSDVERVKTFADVFNIRGARFIASTQEIERVMAFVEQIENAGVEGRKAAQTMESGLGGSFRRATSAANDLVLTIGELNKNFQQAALNTIPALSIKVEELLKKFPPLVILITNLPYVLLAAGVGLVTLAWSLGRVSKLINVLQGGFAGLAKTVKSGFSGIGGLGASAYKALQVQAVKRQRLLKAQAAWDAKAASVAAKIAALGPQPFSRKTAARAERMRSKLGTRPQGNLAKAAASVQRGAAIRAAKATAAASAVYEKISTVVSNLIRKRELRKRLASQSKLDYLLTKKSIADRNKRLVQYQKRMQGIAANARARDLQARANLTGAQTRFASASRQAQGAKRLALAARANMQAASTVAIKNKTILNLQQKQRAVYSQIASKRASQAKLTQRIATLNGREVTLLQEARAKDLVLQKQILALRQKEAKLLKEIARNPATTAVNQRTIADLQGKQKAVYGQRATLKASTQQTVGSLQARQAVAGRQRQALAQEIVNLSKQASNLAKGELLHIAKARIALIAKRTHEYQMYLNRYYAARQAKMAAGRAVGTAAQASVNAAQASVATQRNTAAGSARAARATAARNSAAGTAYAQRQAARSAKASKVAMAGFKAPNMANLGKGALNILSSGGRQLGQLTVSLARFTVTIGKVGFGITRFVASLNPLGLAFNILLMFGHKIPVVVNAFRTLGNGFSAAFQQIKAIGADAGPAFQLITSAISDLSQGNTAQGLESLKIALSSIVDIIQNRLLAAWYSFKMAIAPALDMFDVLLQTLSHIGDFIFEIGANLASSVWDNIKGIGSMLGGGGESNLSAGQIITVFLSGVAQFISTLTNVFIDVKSWFLEGVYILEQVFLRFMAGAGKLLMGGDSAQWAADRAKISEGEREERISKEKLTKAQNQKAAEDFAKNMEKVSAKGALDYNKKQRDAAVQRSTDASRRSSGRSLDLLTQDVQKKINEERAKAEQSKQDQLVKARAAAEAKTKEIEMRKQRIMTKQAARQKYDDVLKKLGLVEDNGSLKRGKDPESVKNFMDDVRGGNKQAALDNALKAAAVAKAEMERALYSGDNGKALQKTAKITDAVVGYGAQAISSTWKVASKKLEEKQVELLEQIADNTGASDDF